jgi:hypothetical protein
VYVGAGEGAITDMMSENDIVVFVVWCCSSVSQATELVRVQQQQQQRGQ